MRRRGPTLSATRQTLPERTDSRSMMPPIWNSPCGEGYRLPRSTRNSWLPPWPLAWPFTVTSPDLDSRALRAVCAESYHTSRQQFLPHLAIPLDADEALLEALVGEAELLGVEAQEVEDRGLE